MSRLEAACPIIGPPRKTLPHVGADADVLEHEAQRRADRDPVVALLRAPPGPVTVTTRSWMPRPCGSRRPISAAVATFTTSAPTSHGSPPRRHLAPEQRRDQHLLGALRILHASAARRSTGPPAMAVGTPARRRSAASGLFASTPMITRAGAGDPHQVADAGKMSSRCSSITRWSVVRYGSHSAPFRIRVSIGLALGDLELDVGRERGAAETDDAGLLDGGEDLVHRGVGRAQGFPSDHLLGRARERLEVDRRHHPAADPGARAILRTVPGRRRVHGDRDEAVGHGRCAARARPPAPPAPPAARACRRAAASGTTRSGAKGNWRIAIPFVSSFASGG